MDDGRYDENLTSRLPESENRYSMRTKISVEIAASLGDTRCHSASILMDPKVTELSVASSGTVTLTEFASRRKLFRPADSHCL